MSERRLLLASASPRRSELLSQLGVTFEVVPAEVIEHEDPTTDPRIMVAHNAALKADWVAGRHPAAFVLGADTTVFIDGQALNKPADLGYYVGYKICESYYNKQKDKKKAIQEILTIKDWEEFYLKSGYMK